MLKQITDGVWVHESHFLQSNAVVVQGNAGLLLIDPGITSDEMDDLAKDIKNLGQPVLAGFSTHPHWDHLLWRADYGNAPRYATARGVADAEAFLSSPDWKTQIIPLLPADLADRIPTDELFGKITVLPKTTDVPWEGPKTRVIVHSGHAAGSAALLIEDTGVLVAGDMLSDILTPFFELDADDPIKDYLAALDTLEGLADKVRYVVPGHGSVGEADDFRARIEQDRAYVEAIRDGGDSGDPRLTTGPQMKLLANVHAWQAQQIAAKMKLRSQLE